MKVVDLMTNDPLTVGTAETVGKADELMAENNIRQVPVVNGRELVGIVTDRDVRAFLSDAHWPNPKPETRLEDISGRYHEHGAAVHQSR